MIRETESSIPIVSVPPVNLLNPNGLKVSVQGFLPQQYCTRRTSYDSAIAETASFGQNSQLYDRIAR